MSLFTISIQSESASRQKASSLLINPERLLTEREVKFPCSSTTLYPQNTISAESSSNKLTIVSIKSGSYQSSLSQKVIYFVSQAKIPLFRLAAGPLFC